MIRQVCCVAILSGVAPLATLSAQNPAPDPASGTTVALIGCLQPAAQLTPEDGVTTSPAPTSGNGQRTVDAGSTYILSGAHFADRETPAAGAGAARGTGATVRTRNADGSVTTDQPSPKTYRLSGDPQQLAEFGGHLVEVSGTIAPVVSSAGPAGPAAGGGTAPQMPVGSPGGVGTPNAARGRGRPGSPPAEVSAPQPAPVSASENRTDLSSFKVTSIRSLAETCAGR